MTTRRLPGDWARRRAAVLRRDGHRCTSTAEGYRCTENGTGIGGRLEVDHIQPRSQGGSDAPSNLRTLCAWHHKQITATQQSATRGSFRSRRAEREPHPSGVDLAAEMRRVRDAA